MFSLDYTPRNNLLSLIVDRFYFILFGFTVLPSFVKILNILWHYVSPNLNRNYFIREIYEANNILRGADHNGTLTIISIIIKTNTSYHYMYMFVYSESAIHITVIIWLNFLCFFTL